MKKLVIRQAELGATELKIKVDGCIPQFNPEESVLRIRPTGVDNTFIGALRVFKDDGRTERIFEFEEAFRFKGVCLMEIDMGALVEKREDLLGEILAQTSEIVISFDGSDKTVLITLKSTTISAHSLNLVVEESEMEGWFTPAE